MAAAGKEFFKHAVAEESEFFLTPTVFLVSLLWWKELTFLIRNVPSIERLVKRLFDAYMTGGLLRVGCYVGCHVLLLGKLGSQSVTTKLGLRVVMRS